MRPTEVLSRPIRGWALVAHSDGDVLSLREFPCRIGRKAGGHVHVTHKTVSLLHAELRISGDELVLVDLGSRNGTFINGKRLSGSQTVVIGDLLQFGAVGFQLSNERETSAARTAQGTGMEDLALAVAQFSKLMDERGVEPHYQPIVTAATGKIMGYEALARSRLFGLASPAIMFKAAKILKQEAELSRMLRTEALRSSGLAHGQ